MSASLDHIVPVSLGGAHVPGNVQLAHLICNNIKADSLAGAQPALF
jgi:5-methylcytosine-specific restriction endonuclease McrA